MLIEISRLRGLPLASSSEEAHIGTIDETLIHPDTGEIIGFWVKQPGLFAERKALSSRDVISYDSRALVASSLDALVSPDDVQPFKGVVKRNERWIGKAVETEAGDRLGKVSDVVVDTDLERLTKLHVSSLFGPDRILSRETIVRTTPQKIIVQNSFEQTVVPVITAEVAV